MQNNNCKIMEEKKILTRSDLSNAFKNSDIISRDYGEDIFYHTIRVQKGKNTISLAIHENLPKEKKFFGRAWINTQSMTEVSFGSQEELFEMIKNSIDPPSWIKKLRKKAINSLKNKIQNLWQRKTHK